MIRAASIEKYAPDPSGGPNVLLGEKQEKELRKRENLKDKRKRGKLRKTDVTRVK
jgi:hypothetical protein